MDEHDKRAREVSEEIGAWGEPSEIVIAAALRAAVAAERERCVRAVHEIAAEYREDAAAYEREGHHAQALACEARADGCDGAAFRLQSLASGATPEQVAHFKAARLAAPTAAAASPAQAERVSEEDEYAVRFETLADAHARGAAETTSRIAARLRARADEMQAAARPALASALRSEADALEGT